VSIYREKSGAGYLNSRRHHALHDIRYTKGGPCQTFQSPSDFSLYLNIINSKEEEGLPFVLFSERP